MFVKKHNVIFLLINNRKKYKLYLNKLKETKEKMLFNSYVFILLFLPITLIVYFLLGRLKYKSIQKAFLIMTSIYFYAYFNLKYVFIILISILGNYLLSICFRKINSRYLRKAIFTIGIVANIGVLFYYKYYNFFIDNINILYRTDYNLHHLILPLGISFFTFQQLSYIVDCYKNKCPHYHILDYALFVSFFPQLIAGPIVLHTEMVPQFADEFRKRFNYDNFAKGITAFTIGLAKKVLIADIFGKAVSSGFGSITSLNATSAFVVMLSYTLQIYFDFSGYCDMAMGIGKMFNIDIPINFNSPYKAASISDFWKRWHMTLTRFFTTYVYIPLGGNRKGTLRTYRNIFIVFAVSGLWHGANWTFVVWGSLHGIAIIIQRMWTKNIKFKMNQWIGWFITFAFINITWILFRADSLGEAVAFLQKMIPNGNNEILKGISEGFYVNEIKIITKTFNIIFDLSILGYIWIAFAIFIAVFCKNTYEKMETFKPRAITAVGMGFLLMWCIVSLSGVTTFLYFNF